MAHPSVVINSVTYADCPEVDIPKSGGGTATFYDASECDAAAANVLSGKKFVGTSGQDTGSMTNNGATGGTISTKAGTYTIPAGYTSGGTVSLGGVTDCVSGNILTGKTILGVQGSLSMPTISQDATTKVLSIS
jgi:hypothetical protein